jgi:U3 small nucleolar RNA-associated protein 14
MAQTVADGMVADKEDALKKLEKAKSKGGVSIAEKIASEKERKAAIDAAKQELFVWQKIAGTANRRKMEADAERRRIADAAHCARRRRKIACGT